MDPKANDERPCKRQKRRGPSTGEKATCRQRQSLEGYSQEPRDARDRQWPPAAGREAWIPWFLDTSEGTGAADPLTLDFWPPEQ